MSAKRVLKRVNSHGELSLDEIAALGSIIILFTSSMALGMETVALWERAGDTDSLYTAAHRTSEAIRNDPGLTVNGQPGMFDLIRLRELDNESLFELQVNPDDHGFSMTITDVDLRSPIDPIRLAYRPASMVDVHAAERAVVHDPVNVRLNDIEVHPAVLMICLWR